MQDTFFTKFKSSIEAYALPERFTFPFYYEPHPLCLAAAEEVYARIEAQTWEHNFGLIEGQAGYVIGKMFGVLVVKNQAGEIGYLAAFSGKLADENHHVGFVPPVYDILEENSFFNIGMQELTAMNDEVKHMEESSQLTGLQQFVEKEEAACTQELADFKAAILQQKAVRKKLRNEAKTTLDAAELADFNEKLNAKSRSEQLGLKKLVHHHEQRIEASKKGLEAYVERINAIKNERKLKSADLQQQIFAQYKFLNIKGETKDLNDIFQHFPPPAGSGECAAPKLLQFAFLKGYTPICMAEFWWGAPPKSEVRQHKNFYPACKGKCEPILEHMLEGMKVDENPLKQNPALGKTLDIVFEDADILLVNKPAEFLSVPGRDVRDSVAFRMKKQYPEATGPLVVHRLDMSTSGLLLVAKSLEVYKILQSQFMKRSIKKRYIALLEGVVEADEGFIDLPLMTDWDDRPRQMVCHENGKGSRTKFEVIERKNGRTRVYFYPITGRTHQLRVHAAHPEGLGMPIVGDDLYGKKADRLHLHAEWIEFLHPVTKEVHEVRVEVEF